MARTFAGERGRVVQAGGDQRDLTRANRSRTPDLTDDLPALLVSIDVLTRTGIPTRAAALADEIARARPHVVGLQDVDDVEIDVRPLRPLVSLGTASRPPSGTLSPATR